MNNKLSYLFFDNFFISIDLVDELKNGGMKATGRENPLLTYPLKNSKAMKEVNTGGYFECSLQKERCVLVCKWMTIMWRVLPPIR